MSSEPFTAEWARERMTYEPDTGRLIWKRPARNSKLIGQESRSLDVRGYVQVNFKPGVVVKGHRLAWLMHYGVWPKWNIDHINGNRADNRIENLRDVPGHMNTQNVRSATSRSKSGVLGARKSGNRWIARVTVSGKSMYVGSFDTPEEAHAAYVAAKRRFHDGCTL